MEPRHPSSLYDIPELVITPRDSPPGLREAVTNLVAAARERSGNAYRYALARATTYPARTAGGAFAAGVMVGAFLAMLAQRR